MSNETQPDNPPAFPWSPDGPNYRKFSGMTLRDWFAGQALAAYICADGDVGQQARTDDDSAAHWAYAAADAMLRAREERP